MVYDFIALIKVVVTGMSMMKQVGGALDEAANWARMFQPIIDKATPESEKKRLEALGDAVMLRILSRTLLGGRSNAWLDQVRDQINNFEMALNAVSMSGASRFKNALSGAGLEGGDEATYSRVFNAEADALYKEYIEELDRLKALGVGSQDSLSASAHYAVNEEQLMVKHPYLALQGMKKDNEPLLMPHTNQKDKKQISEYVADYRNQMNKKYPVGELSSSDAHTLRKHYQHEFQAYLAEIISPHPIRLHFRAHSVVVAPANLTAHVKHYNELRQVAMHELMYKNVHPENVERSMGKTLRKELKTELAHLKAVNEYMSKMNGFYKAGDEPFKRRKFPQGGDGNEYEAVLVLAALAVKLYGVPGSEIDIRGMSIYRLASLMHHEDYSKIGSLPDNLNYLSPYFSEEQKNAVAAAPADKYLGMVFEQFQDLMVKSEKHAARHECYQQSKELFATMDGYLDGEQEYLLKLINHTASQLAEHRKKGKIEGVSKSEKVQLRLGELVDQVLELRKNRGLPEKTIKVLLAENFDMKAAVLDELEHANQLVNLESIENSVQAAASTASFVVDETIPKFKERYKELKEKTKALKESIKNDSNSKTSKTDFFSHHAHYNHLEALVEDLKGMLDRVHGKLKTQNSMHSSSGFMMSYKQLMHSRSDEKRGKIIAALLDASEVLYELLNSSPEDSHKRLVIRRQQCTVEHERATFALTDLEKKIRQLESRLKALENSSIDDNKLDKSKVEEELNDCQSKLPRLQEVEAELAAEKSDLKAQKSVEELILELQEKIQTLDADDCDAEYRKTNKSTKHLNENLAKSSLPGQEECEKNLGIAHSPPHSPTTSSVTSSASSSSSSSNSTRIR